MQVYEPPTFEVLGSLSELTLGYKGNGKGKDRGRDHGFSH